jgi:N-methylhydantoinase A
MAENHATHRAMRLGVEVGGTFTDLIAIQGGDVRLLKVPSTPSEPEKAVLNAIDALGVQLKDISEFVHGSTVATNTILERKGFRTAFVTTAGFRDILEIQRHDRRNIYDINYQKPEPVILREDCFEVVERLDGRGSVIIPLDESGVKTTLVELLRTREYVSVAVCLLNAYENPEHERRVAKLIRDALPDVRVTCSSDIIREFREYERASTTVLSAYVQPVIDRYLGRLEKGLADRGFAGSLSIMQSNGGRIPAEGMRRSCISAFLSGPAAGVVGAARQAARSGFDDLITFDMGGTSSDVCLIASGHVETSVQSEVDGLPIRYPMVDITTIGAGGGSIIWVDDGGMLRVGPRSAGANPGPACYGRGGTLPTVTDAHVVCGTLQPNTFLGGRMTLDPDAARAAFGALADKLNSTPDDVADSALSLAAANIVRAIQAVSTERGRDPRDFALMPFGGAGPLCATEIADELGIRRIVIPPNPGVISAFGLLAADHVMIDVASHQAVLHDDMIGGLRDQIDLMVAKGRSECESLGLIGEVVNKILLDMRFSGQAFELQVPFTLEEFFAMDAQGLNERFRETYNAVFMLRAPGARPVEIVAIRLVTSVPNNAVPHLRWASTVSRDRRSVQVRRHGVVHDCQEIVVDQLVVGEPLKGPALIVSDTSSIFAEPGWSVVRDEAENLVLSKVDL